MGKKTSIYTKNFSKFAKLLKKTDPEIYNEIWAGKLEEGAMPKGALRSLEFQQDEEARPESVILKVGRPVLDVKDGEAILEIDEIESQVWKSRLRQAGAKLSKVISGIGRIDVFNFPDPRLKFAGTGWLIRDNMIVTNRHVAEMFAERSGLRFIYSEGLDGSPISSRVDFLEEFGNHSEFEFPVFEIVHVERKSGPDLAFLRIEPMGDAELPTPVPVAASSPKKGDQVAVIGYPARDPFFPYPEVMDRIFKSRYDKKRLAPGLATGVKSNRINHDCSTLGGNSGASLISLKSGLAVGLHFAGTLFENNHAVPIEVVLKKLDKTIGRSRPAIQEINEHGDSPMTNRINKENEIEVVVPIQIRVRIGDSANTAVRVSVDSTSQTNTNTPSDDSDLLFLEEARPEDYADRKGFDPLFLGEDFEVPRPVLTLNNSDVLEFEFQGETHSYLDYQHFSVLMSKSRRMCRLSACNIDGESARKKKRQGWRFDPRIPKSAQIMKECYGNPPKFSRGHMTRRLDPVWGSNSKAAKGNTDSMHVTNATPQIQPFNGGIWLNLEDYALDNAKEDDMRISVITGPFLHDDDPVRFGVKIPKTFWKIIAFIHDETGELSATGYTMSQASFIGEEEFVFGQHENHQRPIHEIEKRAGISFDGLADVDPLRELPESQQVRLTNPSQIRFIQ